MDRIDCDLDEVIVTSSAEFVSVIDARTRKSLKTYKVSKITSKCLALLDEEYFIGASTNIPDIKMWTVRDEKSGAQVVSPCGLVNALTATSCGTYCVAAFKQEIRVWSVRCGEMLASFTRHYQDVTCLKFTSDDSMFISGSKDGNVLVWILSQVTSVNNNPERVKPVYTWNNHSKEITDIFVGSMGIYSRVVTSSADMTCKLYELDSGILLSTICLDIPLTAVVMDPMEYFLIVGTQKGCIVKINLYFDQPKELHCETNEKEGILAHKGAISCLSVSNVGDKFLSASTDGSLKIWEFTSMSCLYTVPTNDGPITNAFFTLHPAPLLTRQEPQFFVKQLQRNFISPTQRSQANHFKPLKCQKRPLELLHVGSFDGHYPTAILSDKTETRMIHPVTDQRTTENIFQEVYRGETLNEVREINSQIYSYMIDQAFKSMNPTEREENMSY